MGQFLDMLELNSISKSDVVPGAGLEPAQYKVPRDFKSLVSTKFHHPGIPAVTESQKECYLRY